jgi:elongation factor 3
MQSVSKAFTSATTGKTKDDRVAGAAEFAGAAVKAGLAKVFHELKLNEDLNKNLTADGKKGAGQREGALYIVEELCKAEPLAGMFLIPNLHNVLELMGDKVKPVKEAAKPCVDAIVSGIDPNLVDALITELNITCHAASANAHRLKKIAGLCKKKGAKQTAQRLNETIPAVIPFMADLKPNVVKQSLATLLALCDTCDNPDMKPFIPALVDCMKDLNEIPETVFKMASTTFVAEVDGSALSILAPVLSRGLNVTSETSVKRQCARIIENMSKLVDEPRFLSAFMTKILPLLSAAKENVSDPECREVCAKAEGMVLMKAKQAIPLVFDIKKATEMGTEAITKANAAAAKAH